MDYGEAAYFDGAHFAHIAEWQEQRRRMHIDNRCRSRARQRARQQPLRKFHALSRNF
jgi:hypothetical protein